MEEGRLARYQGTYLRILDVGGELVGVRSGIPDSSQFVANGIGFAGIIFAVIALARLSRRGARPAKGKVDRAEGLGLHENDRSDQESPVVHQRPM